MKVNTSPNTSSAKAAMAMCCGVTSRNRIIETAIAAR